MTHCTREERKGGQGTVSALRLYLSEPSLKLHQTHSRTCKQAAPWVRRGRCPVWVWLHPPRESSRCLSWSRGSSLSQPHVLRGPCPCSPQATPRASLDLRHSGSGFTLASASASPLSTVPCHFAWFPPFANPHPVFPVTREKETCLCLQPLLLCSVFCQRMPGFLFV